MEQDRGMKNIKASIEKNKWIIVVLLSIAGAFYWYEWRPAQIEKDCAAAVVRVASAGNSKSIASLDNLYDLCVSVGGIDNLIEIRDANK